MVLILPFWSSHSTYANSNKFLKITSFRFIIDFTGIQFEQFLVCSLSFFDSMLNWCRPPNKLCFLVCSCSWKVSIITIYIFDFCFTLTGVAVIIFVTVYVCALIFMFVWWNKTVDWLKSWRNIRVSGSERVKLIHSYPFRYWWYYWWRLYACASLYAYAVTLICSDAYMRQLFHCLQWYAGRERVKYCSRVI